MAESLCVFCEQGDLQVDKVGETFHKDGVTVHENCLYFASGMGQNGEESEGIRGFLIHDIRREVKRSRSGKVPVCTFCRKKGATVGCAVKSCRQVGHYPCVKELGGFLFRYYDRFEAFCPSHSPKQRLLHPSSLPTRADAHTCCICLSRIECKPSLNELYCPSCKTFLHRDCLQQHAWNAGRYFFRCPVCNNQEEFVSEMLRIGINVPERDAEWERNGQFRGVYEDTRCCRAVVCLCPYGRNHDVNIGKFRMRKCGMCSQSIGHLECTRGESSQCKDCSIPTHRIGISSSPDRELSTSQHGNSDSSEEGGGSNLNVELKELDDEKCNCSICRAKALLPSNRNTSPVAEDDMVQPHPNMSSERRSFSLSRSPEAEELITCSGGSSARVEELYSGSTSPSTGQIVSVRRKLNFSNSGYNKRMAAHNLEGHSLRMQAGRYSGKESNGTSFDTPLPAAKRVKTEPRLILNPHFSRLTPYIKINKLKPENYLPFSKVGNRGPL